MSERELDTLSCPQQTREGVQVFCDGLSSFLGSRLAEVYLYGSLASGCYNGRTSDVDFLAVLSQPLTPDDKQALLELHRRSTIPADCTYVTLEELNVDRFPTPIQCVIRPVKLFKVPHGLIDFLVIRQDTCVNGVCLAGAGVKETIRPVPQDLLAECVRQLFPVALERFKNPILMLCRIVCTLRTGRPCSKAHAAKWCIESFDPSWRPLLSKALAEYQTGQPAADLPPGLAQAFESYCRQYAESLNHDSDAAGG